MRLAVLLVCLLVTLICSGQVVTVQEAARPEFLVDLASGRKLAPHPQYGSLTAVSPDGKHVAFVQDNNLWLSAPKGGIPKPLTQAGSTNLLIGTPDVIYAREFDVEQHFWWSPDSSSIAYLETEFRHENHYIVPGAPLPAFRLKIINIVTAQIRTVAESNDQWAYLLRPTWSPDSQTLIFYRMNRLQNLAELRAYQDESTATLLTENDAYWVNAPETPVFVGAGKRIVVSSERSGNKHVYLYEADGQLVRDLTPFALEVSKLHSTTDTNGVYVSASNGNRQEQHLFRLSLDGSTPQKITKEPGWHEVSLSASGNAYLDRYSIAIRPPSVKWHGPNGKVRKLVSARDDDKPAANDFFTIKTHDNVELPARIFKPAHFDARRKYPVILYTFAGPRGRVVADEWGGWQMAWNRSMVRLGFLVLAVDVRGSGGYGHLFEEYIHYRLGAQEIADLREVVSYLWRQSYVDGERLGIWGCDYGAHTVIHAMWQFPNGFKVGFADSPISDWTQYDAYFTERYLGLPATRFNEYNDSSPLHDARKMTGSLLVAGRSDDPLIRPHQLQALENAIAGVRSAEVRKRFQTVDRSESATKLLDQMTEFFKKNL